MIRKVKIPAAARYMTPAMWAVFALVALTWTASTTTATAGSPQFGLVKCAVPVKVKPPTRFGPSRRMPQPGCGIEITCTDDPVQLGYSDGICFRASSPGIWAIMHQRIDQASFRRRLITYRHYRFAGYWELKDQGTLETGLVPLRELFLVLPDDLIEFRLAEPDHLAKVEIRNMGYVKKGSVPELQKWLARHRYLANVGEGETPTGAGCPAGPFCNPYKSRGSSDGILSILYSLGNRIGIVGSH